MQLKPHFKKLIKILQVLVTIIATLYLFTVIDWKGFLTVIRQINLIWIIPITALYFLGVGMSSLRWRAVLKGLKYNINFFELFKSYLLGTLYNNLLPSSFGGDIVKFSKLKTSIQSKTLIASLLMDRIWGIITSALLSLIAYIVLIFQQNQIVTDPSLILIETLFLIGLIFTVLNVIFGNKFNLYFKKLEEKSNRKFFKIILKNLADISRLLPKTKDCIIYSFIFSLVTISGHYFSFLAFGVSLDILTIVIVPAVISIISIIPISINSIGIKENAFVYYYGIFGASPEISISVALLSRILQLIYSLTGFFFI